MLKTTFNVSSLRKLPNPYVGSTDEYAQMYFVICDVTDIPDDIPM